MSKVVVYLRVSTENQEAEGTSLETQERACLVKAHELAGPGDEVVVLREVYSGLSLERPELSKLREWRRAGQVKAVVVYAADRLSREPLHLLLLVEEIERAGATLAFVTEPHESTLQGQLLTFVRGWASKLEALKIKERTTRGAKERTRRGQLWGKGRLYGYLYMRGKGESRGIRIPDPDKAPIVRDIFEWYVQGGLSLDALGRRLFALGIPSPQGAAQWRDGTLRCLLLNPAYIGRPVVKWRYGGAEPVEVAGACPPLVDRTTFEAAAERLRLNQETARRNAKRDYPLRGRVYCACGRRMVGWPKGERRTYRCQTCHKGIAAPGLEAQVWGTVRDLLANPELVRAQVAHHQGPGDGAEIEARLAAVERRLAALAQGEQRIARMVRLGDLTEDAGRTELRAARQDRQALEREGASLRGQLEAARLREGLDLEALCAQALKHLEAPTPEIQRLALESLGMRVELQGDRATVHFGLPLEADGQGLIAHRLPC